MAEASWLNCASFCLVESGISKGLETAQRHLPTHTKDESVTDPGYQPLKSEIPSLCFSIEITADPILANRDDMGFGWDCVRTVSVDIKRTD